MNRRLSASRNPSVNVSSTSAGPIPRAEQYLKNREKHGPGILVRELPPQRYPFAYHRRQVGPLTRQAKMAQGKWDLTLDGRESLFLDAQQPLD